MSLFLGRNLQSGGVNGWASCCQFASSLDGRSIVGLFLSSKSRKLFMVWSFGGLLLKFLVEDFFIGLIFLLKNISKRFFCTSSPCIFFRHQPNLCPFLWRLLHNRVVFCIPCWLGWKFREVTATALTWYCFNSDRTTLSPVRVLRIQLWFVLHGIEGSKIPLVQFFSSYLRTEINPSGIWTLHWLLWSFLLEIPRNTSSQTVGHVLFSPSSSLCCSFLNLLDNWDTNHTNLYLLFV